MPRHEADAPDTLTAKYGRDVDNTMCRQRFGARPGPPRHRHSVLSLPLPTHELILGGANEAHTPTVVTVVVVDSDEVRVVEVHDVRVVATVVRGRPVETAAAHTADRSPEALAHSRQEDHTSLLQGVPLRG